MELMKHFNEAFSPSAPNWLRNFLISNSEVLRRVLNRAGVSLDTAEFKEYPVPTSNRDQIKTRDDLVVFYLLTDDRGRDALYIPNIDRDENSLYIDGDYVKYRYIAWGKIFDRCKAICYVEKDNSSNFIPDEKRSSRQELTRSGYGKFQRYASTTNPNRRFSKKEQDSIQSYWRTQNTKFDKSGYVLDPERLKRELENHPEIAKRGESKKLESIANRLRELNDAISNAFSYVTYSSSSIVRPDVLEDINSASNNLLNATRAFNSVLNSVLNDGETLSSNKYDYDRVLDYLDRAEKRMLSYKLSYADWDNEDMYIDDED